MEAPDRERGGVQPYPATPRKRWTPSDVVPVPGLSPRSPSPLLIIVEIVVLFHPDFHQVDAIVYNRVIAMIGGGLTTCLSLTGLVIARAELGESDVSSEQRSASLCGVVLCLSPVLVIVGAYSVLGPGVAEWLFGWK